MTHPFFFQEVSNSKRKYQSQWILSSYNCDSDHYPDSLDRGPGEQRPPTPDTSSIHNFQTANNFLWNVTARTSEYYDSIDSNLDYSLYQPNGEDLAECDSLEKRLSDVSIEKKK